MFGKKKDTFKSGELEKMTERISQRQAKDRSKMSGLSDKQYGQYTLEKFNYDTAKNLIKAFEKLNKDNKKK